MTKNKKTKVARQQNKLTNKLNLYLSENIEILDGFPKKPYIVATDMQDSELWKLSVKITQTALKRGQKNVLLAFPLDGNWGFTHFLNV